jgi:hypothetical protein
MGLLKSHEGHDAVLVVVDRFSKSCLPSMPSSPA